VVAAAGRLPDGPDAFVAEQSFRRALLSEMPAEDVLELKLAHATRNTAYQYGLFGNSRIMMVGAQHLRLPDGQVFNFGVSGISFATSVRMIERLAEADRLPGIILLQFDHPEISHPPRPVIEKNILHRWGRGLGDIVWALGHGLPIAEALKHLHYFVAYEWGQFRQVFSFERLRRVIGYRWTQFALRPELSNYRIDGSREEKLPNDRIVFQPDLRRELAPVATGLELERLAHLRGRSRIVIYESPLPEELLQAAVRNPSPIAARLREVWLENCARLHLECVPAVPLGSEAEPPFWPDPTHAPAALLGGWLAQLAGSKPQMAAEGRRP